MRYSAFALGLFCALLAPLGLAAAREPASPGAEPGRRGELSHLFSALREAPDAARAAIIEARIRQLWLEAASPAAALLLRRGMRERAEGRFEEALADFDAAALLAPDAAEVWYQRALAHTASGDNAAALRDLAETLRREPRHFPALLALSRLQEQMGDAEAALRSLEAVLTLHPHLPGGRERARELRRKIEGEAS